MAEGTGAREVNVPCSEHDAAEERHAADSIDTIPAVRVKRWVRGFVFRSALVLADTVMLLAAALLAALIRFHQIPAFVPLGAPSLGMNYLHVSLALVVIWLFSFRGQRLFDLGRLGWGSRELTRLSSALTIGAAGLIVVSYTLQLPEIDRAWILLVWAFALCLVTTGRLAERKAVRILRSRNMLLHPTLIVGSNEEAAELVQQLRKDGSSGLIPVGYVSSPAGSTYILSDLPRLGSADQLNDLVASLGVDTVLFVSSAFTHNGLSDMVTSLNGADVNIRISSGLLDVLPSRVLVNEVSGVPIIAVEHRGLSTTKVILKRALDLAVSGTLIVLTSPLWLMVAVAIKITSRGPVLYRQERVGANGNIFEMLKFRSMTVDAEARRASLSEDNESSGPLFKMRRDPRITPVGGWLRKYSLDEVPQLLNVLKGDMSLVGPRPALRSEVAEYTRHHAKRLNATPGMTGLWQVSGRSDLTFDEMVRLDIFYIENWSLRLDLALLLRTVPAVLMAKGAY